MSDENPVPETVEEAINQPPGYVGTLEEGEARVLASLRQTASQIVLKVGQFEVEKARLLGQLSDIEERSKTIINEATQRFGVEGTHWNVHPDGRVFKIEGGVPH